MNIYKLENRIVVFICCIFLLGRSIYLEYLYGAKEMIGIIAFCGFFIIMYIFMVWHLRKKG